MKRIRKHSKCTRFLSACLCVLMTLSVLCAPALAANTSDEPFGFYISASGYTRMQNSAARAKTDTSALYVYFDKSTVYKVRIQALGATSQYASYDDWGNYTRANGVNVDYVTCSRKVDYSIHSMIKEYGYGWAKLAFKTQYSSTEYISGEWSPDTMNVHTDATKS